MIIVVLQELPSGTVTFLFTDVEGSTKLLRELGAEAYAQAVAAHRQVIREACARHDGVEVDTQGDAFFVAFATAPAALAAASELTESLASGPVRVRVGLHTGTPLLSGEGYVGVDGTVVAVCRRLDNLPLAIELAAARTKLRDRDVSLAEGELFVVPKGVEHCPRAEEEAHVLLIEPRGTTNTGDIDSCLTAPEIEI